MKETEYILVMFDVNKPTDEFNVMKKRVGKAVYEQVKATKTSILKTAILEVDGTNFSMLTCKLVGFGNEERGFTYLAIIDVEAYEKGPVKSNV